MQILGIIPSRYSSSRFPGKPLAEIGDKSMIRRVYEQAKKASSLQRVIVATDDERIFDHVKSFDGDVVMTSPSHATGTDRCQEVAAGAGKSFDVVINIQGDEPFIDPGQIDSLAGLFKRPEVQIGTLIRQFKSNRLLFNENSIKVVIDKNGRALYFSRQAIPYFQNLPQDFWHESHQYYQHIGIYGYRREILQEVTQLPPSLLERAESLEQLRWLENGYSIHTAFTEEDTLSVDTPEDLERAKRFL